MLLVVVLLPVPPPPPEVESRWCGSVAAAAAAERAAAAAELTDELPPPLLLLPPLLDDVGASPAAMLPRIHTACSYTSLRGLLSSEMRVGMASWCRSSMCCELADSCWGKLGAVTGVGGGKKALEGTEVCAPPGGGARLVKLMPPAAVGVDVGKSGAGGMDHELSAEAAAAAAAGVVRAVLLVILLLLADMIVVIVSFPPPPPRANDLGSWHARMVWVKLASKAATASGLRLCEKLSGGKGTDPGGVVVDVAAAAAPAADR